MPARMYAVLVLHRLIPPARLVHERTGRCRKRAGKARARATQTDPRRTRDLLHPLPSRLPARVLCELGSLGRADLGLALRRLRRSFGFDLIHAHNAVPAADAVRRTRLDVPLVVSVHGGDVLYTAAPPPTAPPRASQQSRAARRRPPGARQQPGNRRAGARPRRRRGRAWCISAPISPPPRIRRDAREWREGWEARPPHPS